MTMATAKKTKPKESLAIRKVSELIAERLFTTGDDKVSDRLVQMKDDRDRGGWCQGAVADQVYSVLDEHLCELATAMLARLCQGRM